MRQVNISLPDDLRARLDAASAAGGRGLAEEIRDRLAQSFAWGRFDPPTQGLMELIGTLALFAKAQIGRELEDPAVHFVFRRAVAILLARLKPEGEPVLPAELPPNRPVHSDDLEGMAAGLEAIIAHGRELTTGEQLELLKRAEQEQQQRDRLRKVFEAPPPAPRSHMRKPKAKGGHE
jgi:hypothetical protein